MAKVEAHVMMREVKVIEGSRFRKAYKHNDFYRFKSSEGELTIKPGYAFFMGSPPFPSEVDRIAKELRERLKNKKVEKVELVEGDNYLRITFEGYELIAEIFSKGNIYLKEGESIVVALSKPKEMKTEPFSLSFYYREMGEKPIGAVLTRMLGKPYKNAILKALGIDEKTPLNEVERELIEEEIRNIMAYPKYLVGYEGEKPIDYGLREDVVEGEKKEFGSLSAAMAEYYFYAEKKSKEASIKAMIEERIREFEAKEREAREKADFLFTHASEIDEIIRLVRKGREEEALTIWKRLGGKSIEVDRKRGKIKLVKE